MRPWGGTLRFLDNLSPTVFPAVDTIVPAVQLAGKFGALVPSDITAFIISFMGGCP